MYFFCIADEDKWKTEARTEGGAIQEYMMPYQNLLPTTKYTFRVMAYSKYGISLPATSQESVKTMNKLHLVYFIIHKIESGSKCI